MSRIVSPMLLLALCITAGACRSAAPASQPVEQAVTLEPRTEGGYALKGPYDLAGTLAFAEATWSLEGVFRFPTSGYRVGAVDVNVLKSLPEQVTVVIHLLAPPKDAVAAQVISEVPIVKAITVSSRARFTVRVITHAS